MRDLRISSEALLRGRGGYRAVRAPIRDHFPAPGLHCAAIRCSSLSLTVSNGDSNPSCDYPAIADDGEVSHINDRTGSVGERTRTNPASGRLGNVFNV